MRDVAISLDQMRFILEEEYAAWVGEDFDREYTLVELQDMFGHLLLTVEKNGIIRGKDFGGKTRKLAHTIQQ